MIGYKPPKEPYWRRGASGRYHTYYTPATNLPGVLLMGLIAVLGALAVVIAVRHGLHSTPVARRDVVLGLCGVGAFAVGCVQAFKLWSEP